MDYKKTKKIQFQLRIPEDIKSVVKDRANKLGIPEHSLILLAIDDYIRTKIKEV